ncbi:MAG: LUD domain-containing protein, partial [Candidatus Bathyarchaeota archaeon]|nr:LUD domain-containing protein [Candidatus Bathyarchaeota archaeon]
MELQEGLKRSGANVLSSVDNVLKKHPELSEAADYVKSIREKVLEKLEYYVSQAIENINASGAQAYVASSPEEVWEVVDRIIGKEKKLIVKAKSMVTEEVRLREHLAEMGHEVYETDLGEFLIQISNSKPMHAIVPALHLSKDHVTKLFSQYLGLTVNKSVTHEELVSLFRSFLREKFVKADIGISGANAIAADTGAVFLVHNEGNINNIVA